MSRNPDPVAARLRRLPPANLRHASGVQTTPLLANNLSAVPGIVYVNGSTRMPFGGN